MVLAVCHLHSNAAFALRTHSECSSVPSSKSGLNASLVSSMERSSSKSRRSAGPSHSMTPWTASRPAGPSTVTLLMEFVGTLEALCRLLGSRVARSIYPRSFAIFNTVSLMYPFFPLSDIDRRERQSRVRKGEKSYKALEAVTQRAT